MTFLRCRRGSRFDERFAIRLVRKIALAELRVELRPRRAHLDGRLPLPAVCKLVAVEGKGHGAGKVVGAQCREEASSNHLVHRTCRWRWRLQRLYWVGFSLATNLPIFRAMSRRRIKFRLLLLLVIMLLLLFMMVLLLLLRLLLLRLLLFRTKNWTPDDFCTSVRKSCFVASVPREAFEPEVRNFCARRSRWDGSRSGGLLETFLGPFGDLWADSLLKEYNSYRFLSLNKGSEHLKTFLFYNIGHLTKTVEFLDKHP